jgi:hypothetical protein
MTAKCIFKNFLLKKIFSFYYNYIIIKKILYTIFLIKSLYIDKSGNK